MELRVLKYFLMTAREENITRAAKNLHITQPTLSRQLMQLEEELGTKLFERSNHNIYLTEEITTDESLQAAKDALAQATTDLLNYRDQKYNENFVDENGFTQEYMNWYAQRIVLERRYDFAKAQYELALKKVIEQS